MSEGRVERRLVAILAADVVGYSRLMGQDEAGTLARLKALRRDLIDPRVADHKGRIVKTTGDGLLIEFPSVVEAVACAVAFQREMTQHDNPVSEDERIEFRVGINLGDVIVEGDDIHGDGVNVAARLEGLAEPGGISVSSIVHDQVHGRLDCTFDDTGEQSLKNIARPVRVYRVRLGAAATATAPAAALPLPSKPSLAVLPFQNMTGEAEQQYFVDGMVDEITTALARLPSLFVIARSSSFSYSGRAVDVRQVASELGVRYVLEGSVRKAANRVRITGQLIDTTSGAHVWADRFDSAFDDIFDLQDQVASNVAGAIEPKLRSVEIARARNKPTDSLDAYDLYLRALAERNKMTRDGLREALRLLERALTLDPLYAPAAALAAHCLDFERQQGWSNDPERAVRLANEALAIGRDNPDVLAIAGSAISVFTGDNAAALAAIERAVELNPNSSSAWRARGHTLALMNRPAPAIESLERAMRLSPLDPFRWRFKESLAIAHMVAGRYEQAMDWIDQALRESPRVVALTVRIKVCLCGLLGRNDEARQWLVRMLELTPGATVARLDQYLSGFVAPEVRAIHAEGLRLAGLPET